MRTTLVLMAMASLAAGGGAYYFKHVAAEQPGKFRTAEVMRGDLLPTISSTGTLEPKEVVDVGAQVAGIVSELGIDRSDPKGKKTVDYCAVVQENQVLAVIDPTIYKAQRDQAKASLDRAKANLLLCKATLKEAENDWKRARSLHPAKAISDSDYDLAEANYRTAEANVAVAEATIKQNEAALELAQTNLDYTVIKSPVQGVIVDRRVNVGETVLASLSAPSLFLIAKDLGQIQVWASVNEADIGRIYPDMPVRFTVDAYPGEVFRGKVLQVRLNATMTQNVVTYTVVVVTDNSDGRLLPYLTANLQFELERRSHVLLVPNAALRWKPGNQQIAAEVREEASRDSSRKKDGKGAQPPVEPSDDAKPAMPVKDHEESGRVWAIDDDGAHVRPVDVKVGITDGSTTEVDGDKVKEGMAVVIGEIDATQDSGDTTNPFAPKLFKAGGQKR